MVWIEWYVVLRNEKAQINADFVAISDNGAGDYYGCLTLQKTIGFLYIICAGIR